jgi:hypothetical protein
MSEIKRRIGKLEDYLRSKVAVPWGKIYDALREMDLLTTGVKDGKKFEKGFIKREGTRSEFIKMKEERRNE